MPTSVYEDKRKVIDVQQIAVSEGQRFRVRVTDNGEDIINEACPSGETWLVTMHVVIEITES